MNALTRALAAACLAAIVIFSFAASVQQAQAQIAVPSPVPVITPAPAPCVVPKQPSVDDIIKRLEAEFGVSIAREGEKGCHKVIDTRYKITCRDPKVSELLSLQTALERSIPGHLDRAPRDRGVRFYFLTDPLCLGSAANWGIDSDGRPGIFIEPGSSSFNLTYVLIHELSHNSAYRLGYDPEYPGQWKTAAKLGWAYFENPLSGEAGWMIKLESGDTYKPSKVMSSWVRVNKNGQPLDAAGNRVRRQIDAARLKPAEIAELAQVPPVTNYFPNPMEVYAEAMAYYRASEKKCAFLRKMSPILFELIEAEVERDWRLASKSSWARQVASSADPARRSAVKLSQK